MATPAPGQPVRGSSTGRPLMAALDLFGRRWTLRIVWELQDCSLGFRSLRQRCDNMSSGVLRRSDGCAAESAVRSRTGGGGTALSAGLVEGAGSGGAAR